MAASKLGGARRKMGEYKCKVGKRLLHSCPTWVFSPELCNLMKEAEFNFYERMVPRTSSYVRDDMAGLNDRMELTRAFIKYRQAHKIESLLETALGLKSRFIIKIAQRLQTSLVRRILDFGPIARPGHSRGLANELRAIGINRAENPDIYVFLDGRCLGTWLVHEIGGTWSS